jgi:hypothetical protein
MKKLILLLITLTTLTNVSYASFPVADTLKVKQDTIQTEEIKQYHYSLQKMGIDLTSCKCVSCRNGIAPLTKDAEINSNLKKNKMNIWFRLLIIITILSILFVILLFRWAESFNKSGGIGG